MSSDRMSARPRSRHFPDSGLLLFLVIFVLPAATEIKFRQRSAQASLSGEIDLQVIVELALWLAVVLLALNQFSSLRTSLQFSSTQRFIGVFASIIVVGTAIGFGSALVLVRGFQVVTGCALLVVLLPLGEGALNILIVRGYRWLVVVVVVSLVGTVAFPWYSLFVPIAAGFSRLRFWGMHPIASANLLSLLVLLSFWVAVQRVAVTRRERVGAAISFILAAVLLTLTLARGAIIGTAASLIAVWLFALSSQRTPVRTKSWLLLGSLAGLSAGTFLLDSIIERMVRGQSGSQLISLSERTRLLSIANDMWDQAFWLGHGYLSGRSIFLESVSWAGESHNVLIEAILSFGFLGLVFTAATFIFMLNRFRRLQISRSPLAGLLLGLVLLIAAEGVVGDSFLGWPGFEVGAFWLALAIGSASEGRRLADGLKAVDV